MANFDHSASTQLCPDLYGNDENEYAVPTEHPEEAGQPRSQEQLRAAEEPIKQIKSVSEPTPPAAINSVSPTDTKPQPIPSHTDHTHSTISAYTSPPTQQIPTYQERQDSDYREVPPPRQDYSPGGSADRPVRPSEMKEEG